MTYEQTRDFMKEAYIVLERQGKKFALPHVFNCIEALEKQIPKKPTDIKENEQFHCKIGRCSRCNDWVNDGMNVCDKCYQVIDLSDT